MSIVWCEINNWHMKSSKTDQTWWGGHQKCHFEAFYVVENYLIKFVVDKSEGFQLDLEIYQTLYGCYISHTVGLHHPFVDSIFYYI